MTKLFAIFALFFATSALAGGPVCQIDGTEKTVSAFTPNGVDWTMKMLDGAREIDLGLALFTAPNYNSPMGYTLTTAAGPVVGVLTIHTIGDDFDKAYGFFTKVADGMAETFPVSCTQYE